MHWITELADCLNKYSNSILVVITAVYVWKTHQMLAEMREVRTASRTPDLAGRLEPWGPTAARYVVTNIGPGHALEVELRLRIGSEERVWRHRVFEAGRSERFFLPGNRIDVKAMTATTEPLKESLTYRDAFRKVFTSERELDLRNIAADWSKAGWSIEATPVEQATKKLVDAIEKVADAAGAKRSD